MRAASRIAGLVAVISTLAVACAPQTETVKLYENPARISKTYKRLLVVDISSDPRQQRRFENEVALKLRQQKVEAIPGFTYLDTSKGLLQDDINRVAEEVTADGILITHIVSVDTRVDRVQGREDIKSTCRGGDPVDYFLYNHKVIREPDSVKVAHTVIVITNLYDAGSQDRLWTIQSTCFSKSSMSESLLEEASAIVKQLVVDELI